MSTKSRSLSETPNKKASPATPRVSKPSRGISKSEVDSPSPLQQSSLFSVDRSPRSVPSKPTLDRRSPKFTTPPDKKATRILKPSELQAELNLALEDLRKAKEKLVLVEKEKAQALDELKEAQRLTEEANEKLREALLAQKRAEEDAEIEKFRTVEMEQAGIEAAQKKEDEWREELIAVRNQHALDVATLLSATQELQKVKQELAMTSDAKNQALGRANDATKIAEIHSEKVEILSAELIRLKSLLDSRLEMEANENNKIVEKLKLEIEFLRLELEKTRGYEEKLSENEVTLEQLNVDLEAAKMAESYACNLVEEWQTRVEELEVQVEEAKHLERTASESLESVMKQLEGSNDSLHVAESEIISLKEKLALQEISIGRHNGDLEESECLLQQAKEEASEMAKKVEFLTSELETVKEEKTLALNNEKLAADSLQALLEEKERLINELGNSRDEEEKGKKAMESLASALHEVSSEAREAREKLLSFEVEHGIYESRIDDLKLIVKATKEKYETMLDAAKQEIDILTNSVEQSKQEYQNMKAEWEQKEIHLINCVKKTEDDNSSKEKEISRLVNSLKVAEEEACASRIEEDHLKNSLEEAASEVIYLKKVLGESKDESMRLKENVMDKENELQNILQENEELRSREAASIKKVDELSKLLEEALAKKQSEDNGGLTDCEKDYDMLPKVVEFSEQNGAREVKPMIELQPQQSEQPVKENPYELNKDFIDMSDQANKEVENLNGKLSEYENREKECDESAGGNFKMWESCKIEEKDFSPDGGPEHESFEEELDSKMEGGDNCDQINGSLSTENHENGGTSPSKQQSQKKKKPLLHKFGSLLKKKGTGNHK
ncbi:WEB family At3g02930, chloroplastic-like [Olea europaea subsp. europaea]|uniref:WEB family At3g02930, chloroplastic-like n=2 Tax=Olea europaea subsp. europaea TaxID=158383 RepID=A0A8S0RPP1_OLEEU|nr:WEB family At3g02930, chloroplastic-like [Olea europaea subsp. europaea]